MLKASFTSLVPLQTVLSRGADPDPCDVYQTPPISLALQLGLTHDFEVLLAHGASIYVKDQDGNTPLHVAAMYIRLRAVSILLQHAQSTALPCARDTPSPALTASEGLPWIADMLLETDEERNIFNIDQIPDLCSESTPHNSKQQDSGTTHLAKSGNCVNSRNYHGHAPLHVAISRISEEGDLGLAVCQKLLAAGADPNMETAAGELPLFMALRLLNQSLFLRLLPLLSRYGADINSRDCRTQPSMFPRSPTALQIAAYHRATDLALGLLEHGATWNTVGDDDTRPLHLCVMELKSPREWKSLFGSRRKDTTAQHLIRAGADIWEVLNFGAVGFSAVA